MTALINHFESRLGRMLGGMTFADEPSGLQVAAYRNGVLRDATSYTTVGLSATPIRSRMDGRELRMELLAVEHTRQDGRFGPLPSVLDFVAQRTIGTGNALLRGDVIELGRPLAEDSVMVSVYAALPVYFDSEFKSVLVEDGSHVAVVWLVPVGPSETEFVRNRGWDAFEKELLTQDPDLLDLGRDEIC
ncbi:suppressor of fused domain protein [Micromonospora sp. NPDC007230]|uniref:suppressor of fused domain protein n=1 Tax=Micromonospora sp. NPDC007230 TaxID=3364237 RepID=UPI0036B77C8C